MLICLSMKLRKCATGFFQVTVVGLAGMYIGAVSTTQAATKTVDIIDYAFSPQDITINVSDTIHWVWTTDLHSSTAGSLTGPAKDAGLWDSGLANTGHTFDFTFTASGSYPYYCSYHLFPGSVTVQAAVAAGPPTVTITNPASGSIFNAPATISLAATASETGGSVADVAFFNGTTSLGQVSAAPYAVTATNLGAGDYTFFAVATDAGGLSATNSIVVHVVAPTLVSLSAPQYSTAGTFQFTYSATPSQTYIVDRAAALGAWTPISTNIASGIAVSFQDGNASGAAQYYRVRQAPSP